MKMKAKIAAVIMALSVAVSPVSAAAEWQQDPYQNWQWTENGVPVTGWEFINQNWYYFDGNGYMVTGWQKIDGKQYYFNANGTLAIGWAEIGGNWYYFNGSGEMMTGWQRVEGYWYYMNSQGVMQKGWLTYGRDRYYLDENGAMEIGWVEVGDDWYFMNHDGLLQTGMIEVNGEVFYLDGDGKMVKGDVTFGGEKYKFDEETGAATGSKIPKPGKAFDAFGNEAEVTVAGSSGSSGSSGGTTVIYVPVDNGNSGNQGGNWNPGWDDDDDDDNDNPGWNPGGDGDGDGDDNPSGEPPEPVAEDLQLLDEFFESMVPEINADYGRDFNVSFDKESHVITVEIKNLEKRITNIRYGNLLYELVKYKDGLVTDWKIEDMPYNPLYRIRVNSQGSEYHVPIYLSTYAYDFLDAGLKVFATTESLIGTSTEVTLLLGEELETQPYTVNFVQAAETISDTPTAKMNVVYQNVNNGYTGYSEVVDCIQEGENVRVNYTLPSNMEYVSIDITMGAYGYLKSENQMLSFANTVNWPYKTPNAQVVENSDGSFTTSYYREDGRTDSYKVTFDDTGFTLYDMDLSKFCYYQYQDIEEPPYDIVGQIVVKPTSTKGTIEVNGYQSNYTLDGDGLSFTIPAGDIYDLRLDFSTPFTLNGYSVNYIYLYDLTDKLNDDRRSSAQVNSPDYYYYECMGKIYKEGIYTYKFEYFDFKVELTEQDGQAKITLPQLNKRKMQGVSLDVRASTDDSFACYINGRRSGDISWGEGGQGLTIKNTGYGQFTFNDFNINLNNSTKVNDVYLEYINVRWQNQVDEENGQSWEADADWRNSDGDYFHSDRVDREDIEGGVVYHFQDLASAFDFTVLISSDGKSITFPDLNQSMLEGNAVTINLTVEDPTVEEMTLN